MRPLLLIVAAAVAAIVLFFAFLAAWHWFGPAPPERASGLYVLDRKITDHRGVVREVAFTPDGAFLASGTVDGSAIVRRVSDGRLLHRLPHPRPGVTGIDVSRDGRYLATAAYDGRIRLWDMTNGSLLRTLSDQERTTWAVAFSPDGRLVASGGDDALVRIWDVERGMLMQTLRGHERIVWSVAFSPDGRTLASGSYDFTIRLWDVLSGRLRKVIDGHDETVVAVDFTADGRLASGSDDATARLWSVDGEPLQTFVGSAEHVQAIAVSPDGRWLATGGRDKSTLGELAQNFFGPSESNPGISMRLWDLESGELVQTFSGHADDVNDLAFSPDGKWIASASSDGSIGLWRRAAR